MGKPTLEEVERVLDPMLSDNFVFTIALPKGGVVAPSGSDQANSITASDEVLKIQCRTASKPGSTVEPVPVDLFGHSVQYAGRLTFSHSMSVEYVEDRRASVTKILESWQRLCRKIETQHGSYKSDYKGQGKLTVFDQAGKETAVFNIVNIWPSEVPDIAFDGSGANLITVSATFTYDYFMMEGTEGAGGRDATVSA